MGNRRSCNDRLDLANAHGGGLLWHGPAHGEWRASIGGPGLARTYYIGVEGAALPQPAAGLRWRITQFEGDSFSERHDQVQADLPFSADSQAARSLARRDRTAA